MKITEVKTYLVPAEVSETSWGVGNPWVLVRLDTDTGITGWGQAYTFRERERDIRFAVHEIASILDGMDPFSIEQFLASARIAVNGPGNGEDIAAAAAAIEIALWDILGKSRDCPVHELLGDRCHQRIGVYANCWSDLSRTADELATFAAEQVRLGFKAVKVYPFLYGNSVEEGIASLAAVRDAVGPLVSVFVDMWYRAHEKDLLRITEALEAYGVTWFEDPAAATEVETLAGIRSQTTLPVVSGETLYLEQDFRRLLEHQAADILNPDITLCGLQGITEIADMAKACSVDVSIHNNNTMTIGLAAALQVAAVIPNIRLVEYFPRLVEGSFNFSSIAVELDDDGCIPIPRDAGIGVTVDDQAMAAFQ